MTNPAFARGSAQRFGRARGPVPVAAPPSAPPAGDPSADPVSEMVEMMEGLGSAADSADTTVDTDPVPALEQDVPLNDGAETVADVDAEQAPETAPEPEPEPAEQKTATPDPADATTEQPAPATETRADTRKSNTKRPTKTAKTTKKKDTDPAPDTVPLVVISGGVATAAGQVHILDLDNATDLDDYEILDLVRGLRAVADSSLKADTVKTLMELLEQKLLNDA